jgi:hypothetical protein
MLIDAAELASRGAPVFNGCTGIATPICDVAACLTDLWGGTTSIGFDGVPRSGDPIHLCGDASELARQGIRAEVSLMAGLAGTVAAMQGEAAT